MVICQKSKIDDWYDHFVDNCGNFTEHIFKLGHSSQMDVCLWEWKNGGCCVGIINYDLIFRRPELLKMKFDTIMLDESSMIQNETAKRTKAILKLKTDNVILLSGTPTGGKYEKLYSQMKLLGWDITKKQYWGDYVVTRDINVGGFRMPIVTGYKNVGRLKRNMRRYGCHFLKTDEVFDLPAQTFTDIKLNSSAEYKKFRKNKIVSVDGVDFVGDTTLTQMLYERQLCGAYSADKLAAFADILDSTNDRLIVFYNFNAELNALTDICKKYKRPVAVVCGAIKDLTAYESAGDSVTLIQYQAGAMGLNMQKANKIIYFTPPLSSELYEQSKKRIHRINQTRPCFYYRLICKNSVETEIYKTLEMRKDYTEKLFAKG